MVLPGIGRSTKKGILEDTGETMIPVTLQEAHNGRTLLMTMKKPLKTYTLEEIPENTVKHLHKCPVESCGHELFLTPSNEGRKDRGSTSWRWVTSPEGQRVRELVSTRLPNSCWCGAPLPGAEEQVFESWGVESTKLHSEGVSEANDDSSCNSEHKTIEEVVY